MDYVSEHVVGAIAHGAPHTEVEEVDEKTGLKRSVCPKYGAIPCTAHTDTFNVTMGKFKPGGSPATYVCDPSGKVLGRLSGTNADKWLKVLKEAQAKIGKKPIPASKLAKWNKAFVAGDKAHFAHEFKKAHDAYKKVANNEKAPAYIRGRATNRILKLTETAVEAINQAEFMDDEAEGKKVLLKIQKQVADLPAAKEAVEEALEGMD